MAVDRVPEGLGIWVLQALSYGKSNEHLGMAGTISLSAETLAAVCRDVGRSVAASGFRKLLFVNGHGGQPGLLETVSRDIRVETGLQVFSVFLGRLGVPASVREKLVDADWGIHAGQLETSVVMALDARAVRKNRLAPDGLDARDLFASLRHLTLESALSTAWQTSDMSRTGTIGDPREASSEIGTEIAEFWASSLAAAFKEIAEFEFSARS
jgi:creatinine amidohydrolase/Fe(II)-dependent formamide hydrolase-like protein